MGVSKERQFQKDVEVKCDIYFKYQSIKYTNLRTFLGLTFPVGVENLVIYVLYLSILSYMRKNGSEFIFIGKSFHHGASFSNNKKKPFRNLFWINLRAIHMLQLKLSITENLKISKTIYFTIEIKTLLCMILLLRRSVFENLFVIVDLHDSINRKPLLILFKRFALYWTATFSSGIMTSSKLSSDILTSHWH